MGRASRIGLDLDNTAIDYTPAYRLIAEKIGLPKRLCDRESIRPMLRNSEDDSMEWQRFQSLLYTDGLAYAQPAAGLLDFLKLCATQNIQVCIVSHKTSQTPVQFGARDLRAPAVKWLMDYGIAPGFVSSEDVYFCRTRKEKVQTIAAIGCQVFVDDLIEVLRHPDLPTDISRFLYSLDATAVSEVQTGIQSANFASLTTWLASC
jgi:hypothetical protein